MQKVRDVIYLVIKIIGRNRITASIDREMTVRDLFLELKLSEQSFVCIRNGVPLVGMDHVSPDDDISMLEVFSGG